MLLGCGQFEPPPPPSDPSPSIWERFLTEVEFGVPFAVGMLFAVVLAFLQVGEVNTFGVWLGRAGIVGIVAGYIWGRRRLGRADPPLPSGARRIFSMDECDTSLLYEVISVALLANEKAGVL